MKLGVYGGTFNPIHYGHLRTAEEVYDLLGLDRIIFVPAGKTPFEKPDLVKADARYDMVERAVKGNRHFEVSDIEVSRRGRTFTVDTIRKLKKEYRNAELFFVLGIDAFLDLPGWKNPDELINLTSLVILSRPGYNFKELSSLRYLNSVTGKTLKELDNGKCSVYSFPISEKQKGYLCNVTGLNISASNIRKLVTSGKEMKYLLPDSVKSYIISNKLYVKN